MIFEKLLCTACDVISCLIYISDKVEYLEKEESYRNCTEEVRLPFYIVFAMQSSFHRHLKLFLVYSVIVFQCEYFHWF